MEKTLIVVGVACVVASIVGGGLKLLGHEFPPLKSIPRQVLLGVVGLAIVAIGWGLLPPPPDAGTADAASVSGWGLNEGSSGNHSATVTSNGSTTGTSNDGEHKKPRRVSGSSVDVGKGKSLMMFTLDFDDEKLSPGPLRGSGNDWAVSWGGGDSNFQIAVNGKDNTAPWGFYNPPTPARCADATFRRIDEAFEAQNFNRPKFFCVKTNEGNLAVVTLSKISATVFRISAEVWAVD